VTKNLSLFLTTSILALTLVQHSADAGAPHGFKAGGTAFTSVRNDHNAARTAAAGHPDKPDATFGANHRPAVQPLVGPNQSVRHTNGEGLQTLRRDQVGGAIDKPVVQPPGRDAAFPLRIEAPARPLPLTPGPAEVRNDARAPQSGDVARDFRIPADLRAAIGPLNASPRIFNPAAEKSLALEERTLLRPNHNGAIEQSAMNRYVALNDAVGSTRTVTPAIGPERFESLLGKLNSGIRTGDYRLAPLTGSNLPEGPAGNSRTIVIGQNENGKTVYVPASRLSGSDKRTIDVNCNDCKVVVVGDRARGAGGVEDDRRIVVDGNGDKVITQGDRANGGAGRDGGAVTDNRQITVNGNKDAIRSRGDSADGRDSLIGRKGGDGGDIDDNRRVVVNGNKDKVGFGTNSAGGGNGGFGFPGGRDGGKGGTIDDNSRVVVNGNKDKIGLGTNSVDGGDGGDGFGRGGNGGKGGDITDHRRVKDNGSDTSVRPGADRADGGKGGNGF
jgi:hypothetical protein